VRPLEGIKNLILGIDASNLSRGGGITHLVELLSAIRPDTQGVKSIVIWGSEKTLSLIEDRPWLKKRNIDYVGKGLLRRVLWQRFHLSRLARDEGCSALFIPGGSYAGNFKPVVTMSRNLLPFEMSELRRYGWSFLALRLLLLRLVQSHSYKNSAGVIFLTKYACKTVMKVVGKTSGKTCIIPHGVNPRFRVAPKLQRDIGSYDFSNPYRILYVSIIDQYKHQWHVVDAVADLRKQGFPVVLDLVGPAYAPAFKRLNRSIDFLDPKRDWVRYYGAVPFEKLHLYYLKADLGLFASSCENMPNILLETMAFGLPIACSNRGPMPEVLGEFGAYFNPESARSIADALHSLIVSPELRSFLATGSYGRVNEYSWQRCAQETMAFIVGFAKQHGDMNQ